MKRAKIVFYNRGGHIVQRDTLYPDAEHYYIGYSYALKACEDHLERCAEGAYVTINDQPKFTFSQMDLALFKFFNDTSDQ